MKRRIFVIVMVVLNMLLPLHIAVADVEYIFADSFETDFSDLPEGWSYFGANSIGKVKIETANASDGNNSVRLTDSSTETGVGVQSEKFAIEAGKEYKLIADVYNYSGSASVYLKYWDASGSQVGSEAVPNTVIGSWRTVSVIKKAPDNAVSASIILYISISASGDICYDNIRVICSESDIIGNPPVQTPPVDSQLITPHGAHLEYSTYNEHGDTLGDFSYAGFYAGKVELPITKNLSIAATVFPSNDPNADDTKRIQKIIDEVAVTASPDEMTVIKFESGRYNINRDGISLQSGIVLSGSGQGPNGTVFYAKDPVQYIVLKAVGTAPKRISDKIYITDDYVKAGSAEINVSETDITNFDVGDTITIYHPSSKEWVKGVEMSNITNVYDDNNSWTEDSVDMPTERTITAINGTTISLDFPLFVPLDRNYSETYIYLTDETERIKNFGIENIRLESYYNGSADDEAHSNVAIGLANSKNGFIRNVSAKYFVLSAIRCGDKTKQITIQNCSSLEPISKVAGSRRYSFACSNTAQQILFTGCYSYAGRHDYMSSYSATGPLAFVDNIADSSSTASETHGTWTTGLLYDNLYHIENGSKGFIAFANRGIYGTSLSQGWSGAGCVAWNCLSSTIIAAKPPLTYQNFMIGVWGRYLDENALNVKDSNINAYKRIYRTDNVDTGSDEYFETSDDTPFVGDAYREAETTPVEPRSLYKAQLALRVTGNYRKTKPNAPIIVSPRPEENIQTTSVDFTGIYQLGAKKVTIYVDDKPYDATLDHNTNTFKLTLSLNEGYHKIYVTQTIKGVESTKNADRFIKIGSSDDNSNPDYLSSVYSREKTALIISDDRMTFDKYQSKISKGDTDTVIKVMIDGRKLISDVEPLEMNGEIFIPIIATFEQLNGLVEWDPQTATVTATIEDTVIRITEDSTIAYVNDKEITLNYPAFTTEGILMVPISFISESLEAKVEWIEEINTVIISTDGEGFPPQHDIPNALTIYEVTQSGDNGVGGSIENSLDGVLSTMWAVSGTDESAWGIYDLGSVKTLSEVYLAYYRGDPRIYTFSIEVSTDGENYTKVIDKQQTSGTTNEFEAYSLKGVSARYVKYVGGGNNENAWNSITEILFTEQK